MSSRKKVILLFSVALVCLIGVILYRGVRREPSQRAEVPVIESLVTAGAVSGADEWQVTDSAELAEAGGFSGGENLETPSVSGNSEGEGSSDREKSDGSRSNINGTGKKDDAGQEGGTESRNDAGNQNRVKSSKDAENRNQTNTSKKTENQSSDKTSKKTENQSSNKTSNSKKNSGSTKSRNGAKSQNSAKNSGNTKSQESTKNQENSGTSAATGENSEANSGDTSGDSASQKAESSATESPAQMQISFQIQCTGIMDHRELWRDGIEEIIPKDGIFFSGVIAYEEGKSVYDLLKKICKDNDIAMDSKYTPMYGTYYVQGIGNLYEFDCGEESGWKYSVNGVIPGVGCSSYTVEKGDQIVFFYDYKI